MFDERGDGERMCETPKSPPGDYNLDEAHIFQRLPQLGVKHLNPRQGITTIFQRLAQLVVLRRLCETPKSPPGDYNWLGSPMPDFQSTTLSVKHLNPRQGITTRIVPFSVRYAR